MPSSALPEITKTLPCLKCAANTTQLLGPTELGCAWKCTVCSNTTHAYTHEQMQDVVLQNLFGVNVATATSGTTIPVPNNLRVFLECLGPDAMEKEASRESIVEHTAITGSLPEVGKPMLARPSPKTHPKLAMPYGKVLRVEHEQT